MGEARSSLAEMLGALLARQRAALRRGDFEGLARLGEEAAGLAETLGGEPPERAVAMRLAAMAEDVRGLLAVAREAAGQPPQAGIDAYDEKGAPISSTLTSRQGKQL